MSEQKFVSFERWAQVIAWVGQNERGHNPRCTYYASPEVHDEGKPLEVSCNVVVRVVNGKADRQVRVSESRFSDPRFEPFDANSGHLGYFLRGESTSLSPAPVPSATPFKSWTLREPDDGPLCKCVKCKLPYRAFPFQSREYCKDCRPPTQRCMHGVTEFEPCPKCKKVTGRDGVYLGVTKLILPKPR